MRWGRPILLGTLAFGLGLTMVGGGVRVSRPPPPPSISLSAHDDPTLVPAQPVPVAVPAVGSLALHGDHDESLASLNDTLSRPIGSVAKTMTALVVLEAHPLADAGDSGPVLTLTAADVAIYRRVIAEDGSSVPVIAGERLSERDLLLGLMLPSANNFAETLGDWVAGDHIQFVARLNARAQQLGMIGTHFDDESGFSQLTVATAVDLVRLGRAALDNAALAAIVATRTATLPDGTRLENLDVPLGDDPGWLGIKTGETPSAGGCLLFAARHTIGAGPDSLTVIGAVLGQPGLQAAFTAARQAVATADAGYVDIRWDAQAPMLSGQVTTRWGAAAGVRLGRAHGAPSSLLRAGTLISVDAEAAPTLAPLPAGAVVGKLVLRGPRGVVVWWDAVVDQAVPAAPLDWRLLHG